MRTKRAFVALVVLSVVLALVGATEVDAQSERFEHTGGVQTFTVPEDVTEVQVETCGAAFTG